MKTIKLSRLHKGQKRIVEELFKKDAFYNVIRCSRQYGKSKLLSHLLLYYSFNYPTVDLDFGDGTKTTKICTNLVCTPTYSLATITFNNIVDILDKFNGYKNKNKAELSITLNNNVKIYFKGVDKDVSIRGISVSYMFLDEFAFYKDETWDKILEPMLSTVGKKVFLISTPNGKQNPFHTMSMKGETNHPLYYSAYGHYSENPFRNQDIIDNAKLTLPSDLFDQEYNAKFIDNIGGVFSYIDDACILKQFDTFDKTKKYFAGIDWGRSGDSTVLTILDQTRKCVLIYTITNQPFDIIIENVVKILNFWKPITYSEKNGLGLMPTETLQKKVSSIIAWNTSNENKNIIVSELIKQFNLKTIKLPTKELFKDLYNQLNSFECSISITGLTTYSAPKGLHDDCVMSLALANYCVTKCLSTGGYDYKQFDKPNRW